MNAHQLQPPTKNLDSGWVRIKGRGLVHYPELADLLRRIRDADRELAKQIREGL